MLRYLGLTDLLQAQRVSRTVAAVINGSPHLQTALFFQAQSDARNTEQMFNSLVNLAFRDHFVEEKPLRPSDHLTRGALTEWLAGQKAISEAHRYSNASWRRMLLAQLPTITLKAILVDRESGERKEFSDTTIKEMTMGEMDDEFQRIRHTEKESVHSILWQLPKGYSETWYLQYGLSVSLRMDVGMWSASAEGILRWYFVSG